MKNDKIKVTLINGRYEWVKDATSFEHGVTIAQNLYKRFGLIGRMYIQSSCGKSTWIN